MANKLCKACRKNIGKKIKLQCGRCTGYFHLQCGNVTEVDARLMQAEKTSWTCKDCTADAYGSRCSSVFNSPPKPNGDDISELKNILKELQSEVRDIKRSMDFINEKYEEEKKRNKIMSEMFEEISRDNQTLKEKVQKLESVMNIQNASKIRQNICISGLPINGEQATSTDVVKLCTSLDVPVTANDVEDLRQFKTQKGIKIIVTLKDLDLKRRILAARSKKGKLTPTRCGLGTSDAAIFINEELTKETYNLFKKAKNLKELGYKYVWHRNGKVLVRKNDGDNPVFISSESVLNELLS